MTASGRFLDLLRDSGIRPRSIRISLHGSLAFTGKGHSTDTAAILGLAGFVPDLFEPVGAKQAFADIGKTKVLQIAGLGVVAFDPETDLIFDYDHQLPGHANGMVLYALNEQGDVMLSEEYYSIGGGFVQSKAELAALSREERKTNSDCPFPFATASEMLNYSEKSGFSVAQMKKKNELVFIDRGSLSSGIDRLWSEMNDCISRGLVSQGNLPGGLNVQRRAPGIFETLKRTCESGAYSSSWTQDWLCCYAMAVNEENASGGRVVTAPTNGASGVLPAVLQYWLDHVEGSFTERIEEFFLTASAIGGLIKYNASISGAEGGCQAEVGSASAMAAAGYAAVMNGSPKQDTNAAEIALEHHLGMTCDPVRGLVQVPCIERNGLGAVKAVTAASLALHGDGNHIVSLDAVIETMRHTGLDMSKKYKETSLGGLSVNVPNC